MSEYLYKNTEHEEGSMTKLRAHYVCEQALYEYSLRLGLNEFILLGRGESESGGKFRRAIVADIFESFIGAHCFQNAPKCSVQIQTGEMHES